MKNEDLEEKTAVVLATANLTQKQSELLLVKALLQENSELSEAIDGKEIQVIARWETSKWSDPNVLVNLFFIENAQDQQEAADTVEAADDADDDEGWGDDDDSKEAGSEAEGAGD